MNDYFELSSLGAVRIHHEAMLPTHIYGHSRNAGTIGSYKKRCKFFLTLYQKKWRYSALTWNTVFSVLPIPATEARDSAGNDYH